MLCFHWLISISCNVSHFNHNLRWILSIFHFKSICYVIQSSLSLYWKSNASFPLINFCWLHLFSFQSQFEINSSHRSVLLQIDLLHDPILTIFISKTQRKLEISDIHWKPIMLCFKNLKRQKYIENQLECFVLNFDTSDILWQCKLDAPNAAERSTTQIGFPILKKRKKKQKNKTPSPSSGTHSLMRGEKHD